MEWIFTLREKLLLPLIFHSFSWDSSAASLAKLFLITSLHTKINGMKPLKIVKYWTEFVCYTLWLSLILLSDGLTLNWFNSLYLLQLHAAICSQNYYAVAKLYNQFRKLVEMWEYHVLRIFDRNCIKYPWFICGVVVCAKYNLLEKVEKRKIENSI